MKKSIKRILSLALSILMLTTILCMPAFAIAEESEENGTCTSHEQTLVLTGIEVIQDYETDGMISVARACPHATITHTQIGSSHYGTYSCTIGGYKCTRTVYAYYFTAACVACGTVISMYTRYHGTHSKCGTIEAMS